MGTKERERAAIYARVSQDKRRGRSVEEQKAEARRVCEENGWQVAEERVYADNDVSASRYTTKERPDWSRVVADLSDGRYEVLVLWEPSRGSRDLSTWTSLLDACRDRGVRIHIVSHGRTYNPRNFRDRRSLAEDGVDSEYESAKMSERIKRTMDANAMKGEPHGRSPYGYRRHHDESTGKVTRVIDPTTAPVVRDIFRRLAAGEPVQRVTNWLNEQGVPSDRGARWSRSVVRGMGLNRAYIAEREHKGQVYEGTWEPIVTPEQFYAVKSVLEAPERKTTRPGAAKHLLSYVARCGTCDALLSASPARGYFCSNAGHVTAQIEMVDHAVVEAVIDRLEHTNVMERLAQRDDSAVCEARAEAARHRGRLDEARDAYVDGDLSIDALKRIEAKSIPLIEAAERRASEASMPVGMRGLVGEGSLREKWQAMPVAAKRDAIAMLMTVHLDPSKTRGRHSANEFDRVRWTFKEA